MSSHEEFEDDGEGFGQNVDLTSRIREILGSYPEGTSIIKELIQNADDATASKFKLCFDKRQLGTTTLLSPKLAQYQGPSLLCYNNKTFSQQDYDAIRKVGAGAKRKDVAKTGRFGIGFNAVYHLTDLPSFVSGPYCVYFDPHMTNLPGLREPGKRFNVSQSNAKYSDQFSGFSGCFGYNPNKDYAGTLFRLPLRTPEQAKKSNLSRQSYTTKVVEALFEDFMKEAPQLLLFLRNLVSIKLYTWEPGHNEPTLLFKSKIENKSNDLSAKRLHFVSRSEELVQKGKIDEARLDRNFVSYRLKIAVERPNLSSMRQEWMVGQLFGGVGGKCLQIAYESLTGNTVDGVRIPWGGVAALVSSNGGPDSQPQIQKTDGIAFCTLPLPLHTHLPVHVNATFALTDNRRDLWLGDDMRGEAKKRSDWNYGLLGEVIAPAYALVLLEIAKNLAGRATTSKIGENCNDFYSMWPHWKDVNRDNAWGYLTRKFYDQIGLHPVFPLEQKTGLRFATLAAPTVVFSNDKRQVYPDVESVLLDAGIQLSSLPKTITDSLEKYQKPYNSVNPSFVRSAVPRIQTTLAAASPIVLSQVFQFCLSDLALKSSSTNNAILKELHGLPIVPLLRERFLGILTTSTPNPPSIFVLSPEELILFENSQEHILNPACTPYITDYIPVLSRSTNIRPFSPQELPQYLPKILPSDWHNKHEVPVGTTVSKVWVEAFWKYVQHHKLSFGNIAEWPLLPTTDNKLVILSASIRRVCCMVNLPVHACEFFKVLGVRELDSTLFPHALSNQSDQLWTYVGRPQLNSLLDCAHFIFSSTPEAIPALFEKFTADQRRKLRHFVCSHHNKLSPDQQDALRKFPIFEVHDPSATIFVNLNSEVFLPPSHINPLLLTTTFLRATSPEEEALLKTIGVKQLPTADFLLRFVFPVVAIISEQLREEAIQLALRNMSKFQSNNPFFMEALQNLDFVPTTSKLLKKPRQLYHPKLREQLADILHEDDFPTGQLASKDNLPYLEKLGLQTEMTREGFLMCTQRVAELATLEPSRSVARGRALLAYLDSHFARFTTEKSTRVTHQYFCSELMSIKWLPVVVLPEQEGGVPWLRPDTLVQAPVNMRPKQEFELVGCAKYVIDDSIKSRELLQCFQWNSTPPVNVVAQHLLQLGTHFTPATPVSNITAKQNLAIIIPKVYQYLSNFVGHDEIDWSVLQNASVIWNGAYFLPPTKIAFASPARSNKYLSTIPADLTGFTTFLQFLGVRDKYGIEDFMQALLDVALDYSGKILPPDMLDLAVVLDQHIAELSPFYPDFPGKFSVYLPDEHGILVISQNLVYNDASWLDQTHLLEGAADMKFVHPRISYDISNKLGVKSIRQLLIYKNAQNMELGFSTQHMEAFGQHESITNRIRNILQLYPEGTGILTELLQNADDARASTFALYLDKNSYPSQSLMAPKMEAWQGPSLCVFNNALFTNEDFRSLSTIGQDRKLDRPGATGRFGLGFNAVYHLTDVPSIVSGPYLVYLDPHAHFVPGATSAHPGIKIDFTKSGVANIFPDQCLPFKALGPNLRNFYDGTFFRFPLRTEATAKESEIKKQIVNMDDVENMLRSLQKSASTILLFLKNVRKISVFVHDIGAKEPRLAFSTEVAELGNQNASRIIPEFVAGTAKTPQTKEAFYNKLSSIPLHLMPTAEYVVEAVTRFASFSDAPRVLREKFAVCSLIGGDKLLRMATSASTRHLRLIPWAGVASLIGRQVFEGETEVKEVELAQRNEGKLFCFLPLPVETGLPVHVHACFELSSNRRDILSGEDMHGEDKLRFNWNSLVISEIVPHAYARLISFTTKLFTPQTASHTNSLQLFYNAFPDLVTSPIWKPCVKAVYELLVTKPVLWSGDMWVAPKSAMLVLETKDDLAVVNYVLDELRRRGAKIVDPPTFIRQALIELCGSAVQVVSGSVVRAFLRATAAHKFNAQQLSLQSSIALFLYCLSGAEGAPEKVATELTSLQVVPLADNSLGIFGRNYYTATAAQMQLLPVSAKSLILHPDAEKAVTFYLPFLETQNILKLNWQLFATMLPGKSNEHDSEPSKSIWMKDLWQHINTVSSSQDLANFVGLDIIPIKDARLECELAIQPITYLDTDNLSEDTKIIVQKLGILEIDTSITGKSGERNSALSECLPVANVRSICQILMKKNPNYAKQPLHLALSSVQKHMLRKFICSTYTSDAATLNDEHRAFLRALPIFCNLPKWGIPQQDHADNFISLQFPNLHVPNPAFDMRAYGPNFLRIESPEEVAFVKFLGITEISKSKFLLDFVLPNLETMPADVRDDVMLRCVRSLATLQEENEEFFAKLVETKFVSTLSGQLKAPNQLYSVDISANIKQFLDPEMSFPSGVWVENEWTLVPLGLNKQLGESGVIMCAQRIHELAHGGQPELAVNRSKLLLSYLDVNPPTYKAPAVLANLEWLPVMLAIPPHFPKFAPKLPVASPANCRPKNDLPFASGSLCLVELDIHSESLLKFLGYDVPLSMITMANQIIAYGRLYESSLASDSPDFNETSIESVTKLYEMLQSNLECNGTLTVEPIIDQPTTESADDTSQDVPSSAGSPVALPISPSLPLSGMTNIPLSPVSPTSNEHATVVHALLSSKPCVCLAGKFFLPSRTAFQSSIDTGNYFLACVPEETRLRFGRLFKWLGTKDLFSPNDFALLLSDIRRENERAITELTDAQLSLAVKACSGVAENMDLVDTIPYVPTQTRHMAPASDLVFDDASWITDPAILAKYIKVAPEVPNDIAEKLGCQSLRKQVVGGGEKARNAVLTCPSAAIIVARVGSYALDTNIGQFTPIMQYLAFDMLEVADALGSTSVHFAHDNNTYPAQSLLLPGLAPFQGPSLTILFRNAVFDQERAYTLHSFDPSALRERRLKYGWGIASLYTVSPILFALSQDNFYIFDPSANYLPAPSTPKAVGYGRATHFKLSEVATKFPDQFKPFSVFGSGSDTKGLILRIPLSHIQNFTTNIPPHLSTNDNPLEAIKNQLKLELEATLVFLPDMEAVIWANIPVGGKYTAEFSCSLQADNNAKTQRKALMSNTSWKSFLGLSWFSGPDSHMFEVATTLRDQTPPLATPATSSSREKKWAVSVCYGVDGSKTHAKQHQSNNFYPMGACAAVIWSNGDSGKNGSIHSFLPTCHPAASAMHISAAFEVDKPTRDLYAFPGLRSSITTSQVEAYDDRKAVWNRELLACVAQAMIQLLTYCNTKLKDPALIMKLWPVFSMEQFPNDSFGSALGRLFYKKLGSQALLMDQRGVQKPIKDGYFLLPGNSTVSSPNQLSTSTNQINPPTEVTPPASAPVAFSPSIPGSPISTHAATAPSPTPPPTGLSAEPAAPVAATATSTLAASAAVQTSAVEQQNVAPAQAMKKSLSKYVSTLAYECFPIFSTSTDVSRDVLAFLPNDAKFVTPASIRDAVRKFPRNHKMFSNIEFVLNVLEFCLSDKEQLPTGKSILRGLKLLPLATNDIAVFGENSYIVANKRQQSLLPQFKASFVHQAVMDNETLATAFNSAGFQQDERLTPLTLKYFIERIKIPSFTQEEEKLKYLRDFWEVLFDLAATKEDIITPLKKELLLPIAGVEQEVCFVRVAGLDKVVIIESDFNEAAQLIIAAFKYLGAIILHRSHIPTFHYFKDKFAFSVISPSHPFQEVANTLIKSVVLHDNSSKMPEELRVTLVNFLSGVIEAVPSITEESKQILRTLPLFPSLCGTRVSAETAPHYVGGQTQTTFLKYLTMPPETILVADPEVLPLARFLGVVEISNLDVLTKHIFPQFLSLNPEQQDTITESVKTNADPEAVAALCAVPFVTTSQGLQKVDALISPKIALAKILGQNCSIFPAGKYASSDWISFMENRMNLRKTVNSDVFLLCVRAIVEQSAEYLTALNADPSTAARQQNDNISIPVSKEIFDKAFLLIEYFSVKNFATLFNPPLCKKLAELMVVPVEFPRKGNYRLTSFSRALLPQYGYLVWKVRPVIPSILVPPNVSHQHLSLTAPTTDLVVLNLLAIKQDDLDYHWQFDEPIQAIFLQIFTFLQDKWNSVPQNMQSILSNARIVPCGPYPHRLVQPSRLYTHTEYNFEPFIFEIPREMSGVDKVLKALGAADQPSIKDIVKVLHDVKVELRGQSLNPSEIVSVCKMLVHITGSLDAQNTSQFQYPLVAPTATGMLVPITQCLFVDDSSLVPLLGDQQSYFFASSFMDNTTCEKLKIQPISKVIRTRLQSTSSQTVSPSTSFLQANLTSSALAHAIHCVFFHQRPLLGSDSISYSPSELHEMLHKCAISFVTTLDLEYSLVDLSGKISRLNKPANFREPRFFVDYTSFETLIYLSLDGGDGSLAQMAEQLGSCLVRLLRLPDTSSGVTLTRLLTCAPGTIPSLISGLGNLCGQCGVCSSESKCACECYGHETRRCVPGGILLEVDIDLMKITPTRNFTKGEIVAFEERPTIFKYARVISHAQTATPKSGTSLSRVEIDIGNNQKRELLSSQLYGFGSNADKENNNATVTVSQSTAAVNPKTKTPPVPRSSTITSVPKEKGVTVEDYASALHELAKKAGVQLDDEKDTLIYNNMKLKSELDSMKQQLSKTQSESESQTKRIDNFTEHMTCNICCTDKKDTAVIPCGHVLCGNCAAEMVAAKGKCWCRAQITSAITLKGLTTDI